MAVLNITFTDSAQEYLSGLLGKQETEGMNVRMFVTQPGSPHAETCLAYCKPDEYKEDDIVLQLSGFLCYIEAESEPYLDEAMVDYGSDRMGGQLTIKAPNAKAPRINEDSPLPDQINYYLTTEVNPGLASHGGQVSLVEMDGAVAILQFGGGCQGCGMVEATLKDGVEKTLIERIPQLEGVRDVTDHSDRTNAYFK